MKRWSRAGTALAVAAAFSLGLAAASANAGDRELPNPDSPDFARLVMERIDDMHRGAKSYGVTKMEVKTRHWTRSMSLESWSLGKDYSLIRILSPKKEKGTATLKAKNDLFTYLSKTGRTVKITSGMMGGSWMGSHFTHDDLVKASRYAEDYSISRAPDGMESGVPVHRFTLTPKPDAAVVWGKIEVTVRRSDLAPLSQLFYDEEGAKLRLLEFSEHKEIEGIARPMKMVMKPLDRPGEYTRMSFERLDFGVKLDVDFFTLIRLKSM